MTVTTKNVTNTTIADGIEVTFNFDFQALDPLHIHAYVDGVEDTDITVVLNPDQDLDSGGTVTFDVTTPPDQSEVLIAREIPLEQLIDYQEYGPFPALSHERGLDKLTMMMQENADGFLRSIRFPIGDPSDPELPNAATRSNRYLAFDLNGDLTLLVGSAQDPNAVQKPAGPVINGNLMEFDANKDAVDSGFNVQDIIDATKEALHPVGSVYIATVADNPSTLLGFGNWVATGEGRVLVGVGTSDTAFALDDVGGESAHQLTVPEMPSHNHGGGDHNHDYSGALAVAVTSSGSGSTLPVALPLTTTNSGTIINTQGSDNPHNNLQPYLVVHMWERVS